MSKVILICGKICAGKTVYAQKLIKENNAVLLSSDELISSLFHPNENEYHDKIIKNVHEYLLNKSVEILGCGADVILDWGFWTKVERNHINEFYSKKNIQNEWYYLDISKEKWLKNIEQRNKDVSEGITKNYYVDSGLILKLESLFEIPEREEMDVWCEVK